MDIRKILEYALQREYEGKAFFENNADRLSNAAARGAFIKIAKEEQRHIDFILAHLASLDANKPLTHAAPEMDEVDILTGRAASEMIEQSVNESMVADLPVLRLAYLIERDFSEFYHQAAAKAEGEAKKTLEMLAHWEAGHERLFKRLHDEAFEKYTDMPWGG